MSRNLRGSLLIAALLLGPAARAFANSGEYSFQFLSLAGSARQAAMGNTGLAYYDEAGLVQFNPAALSDLKTQQLYFSYHRLFSDIGYSDAAYARPTNRWGNLGGSFRFLDYGHINRSDAVGTQSGNVSASSRMLQLSWAGRGEGLAPGINLKFAQEKLDDVTATAYALDAGVIYHPPTDHAQSHWIGRQLSRLTFGAALRNAGPDVRFINESHKLPLIYGMGLAHHSMADALTLALDLEHAAGRPEAVTLKAGGEIWMQDAIAARIGYRTDQDIGPGISLGLGLKVHDLRIDYSFTPFSQLGDAHRFSLAFRFGRNLVNRYYEQALHEMRLGNHAAAVLLFDKALIIEPKNQALMEKALEAARALEDSRRNSLESLPSLQQEPEKGQ